MSLKIGDVVRIVEFDDGNQQFKNTVNMWKITAFRFNESKSIITPGDWIENKTFGPLINPRTISTWKLQKVESKFPE